MPDSVKGTGKIDLQPGDANVPLTLKFNPASASTKNDGAIPYGSTLASIVSTTAHSVDGGGSTAMVQEAVASSNKAIVYLSYSTAIASGLHHVTVKATFGLSGSTRVMTRQFDFNRVYVSNR